jgi:hypothetical protein
MLSLTIFRLDIFTVLIPTDPFGNCLYNLHTTILLHQICIDIIWSVTLQVLQHCNIIACYPIHALALLAAAARS